MTIHIKVNGREIEVPAHYTVLQAAELSGCEIPRFCFHESLSIAGNCRMCLVEVKYGPPKPQASCAIGVRDLRPGPNGEIPEIFTNTEMVKKARKGVMEFLLINHPLDCPVCDQGGECDLQDQAMLYGYDRSRYTESKRAVEDKYIGPLVKTFMTRCIHCTRCVRFVTEVAGIPELGMIGRGEDSEITTYLERAMTSELQGNVIDLCPVGALTAKPYAFHARSWELTKTESIDVMDAIGSAICIDSRGREVMRITPRINADVNEEWISDKTRFIWDGLRSQRLDKPYLRKNGKLQPVSWPEAFAKIQSVISETPKEKIGAIAGDLASVEEMYALKTLLISLGSRAFDCRQRGFASSSELGRASYIFNPTISGIEEADAFLIVGSNPRIEAAVLNARILRRQRAGQLPVALIGEPVDLRYPYSYLGGDTEALRALIHGKVPFFDILKKAEKPLILIGEGAISGEEGLSVLKSLAKLAHSVGALSEKWNGFSVLHTAASTVGGLDIGFTSELGIKNIVESCEVLFLLGADEVELSNRRAFTIYIGSHGDNGAHASDVILPASAYTEKSGLYVNTEGRVQMTNRAGFAPGDAKEDWAILRALSDVLGKKLPFDSLFQLRKNLFRDFPHLSSVDSITPSDISDLKALGSQIVKLGTKTFTSIIKDFYLTNPIARASETMAKCSLLAKSLAQDKTIEKA